jgi:tetratricopeptide (TPR) repeat protein
VPVQALIQKRGVIRWFIGVAAVAFILASINAPFWKNAGNIYVVRLSMLKNVDQSVRLRWNASAESLYGRIVSSSPKQSDVWMWLAEANADVGDWESASGRYRRFVLLGGDRQRAFNRLRALASYQGWCQSNGPQLLDVAQQISSVAQAYRLWGDACVAVDDLDLAIDAYRHVLQFDHTYSNVALLASTLMQDAEKVKPGSPERATSDYADVVQLLERFPLEGGNAVRGYYMLAWSYWQINRFDKALEAYDRCVGADSSSFPNRDAFVCSLYLGYAYSQWLPPNDRDFNKALAYFQHAEKIAPYDINLFEVKLAEGQTWLQLDNSEKALMFFQDAVRLQPTCLECGLAVGDTLVALGRVAEARNQYRDILRRFPGNQRAVTALEKLEGQ